MEREDGRTDGHVLISYVFSWLITSIIILFTVISKSIFQSWPRFELFFYICEIICGTIIQCEMTW
jgi:hypothetical protein